MKYEVEVEAADKAERKKKLNKNGDCLVLSCHDLSTRDGDEEKQWTTMNPCPDRY